MRRKRSAIRRSFLPSVILVVLFDQFTKSLALSRLNLGETVPILSGIFHLTLIQNTGIAFGLLQNQEALLTVLISVSLVFLLYWGMRMKESSRLSEIGFSLILGGAIGNWIDRLRHGAVIDFLDFRVWPVFNIADSAITVGVGLYLILLIKSKKREETK